MKFTATIALLSVIVLCFILDTFFLIPKGTKIFNKSHLIDGDKSGYLTKSLCLSYAKIKRGQVWRLFSQVFLHAGLPHLIFNCLAILFTGYALESAIGGVKTLACFFFSALFSGIIMCFAVKLEGGVGASTGIYGLIACYVVTAVKQQNILFSPLPWYLVLLIGVYTIVGMLISKVDRQEHSSGFLGGIVFSFVLYAFWG